MKLARPDVFHPRIVLAGCPQQVSGDGDDDGLVAALRKRGLHARWLSWDDPETLSADLVILRATRDHSDRIDEFLAWTTRVRHLLNAPAVVAWNVGKGYLADLSRRGVPTASGGAKAETALVFVGGKSSHAFTENGCVEPDFEIWDVGFAALDAAAAHLEVTSREFLYARADIVGGIDDPRLARLNLIDPSLGWRHLDEETRDLQQRAFARAVVSALDRLGLGPLSHRRP
ncbi:MAG TPA: hypothetical protein VFB19_17340 [Mycobacterium sp.]|nr:hypothetical protein [Mycobacterium sp.]